jgi:integrase
MKNKKKQRPLPPGARANPRIRWRSQKGGPPRAYAELRDLGGGQPALIAPGESLATTDPEIAESLLTRRLVELEEQRRNRVLLGIDPDADLAEMCIYHLGEKEVSGEYDDEWLEILATYLARAVAFFTRSQRATVKEPDPEPEPRNLATISVLDVRDYAKWLRAHPNGRGGTLGPQSRRHHLSALSGVFKRAISEGKLPVGSNPVAALMDKPTAPNSRTPWMEVDELALLLESARVIAEEDRSAGRRPPLSCVYELLATFLLTGARESEIRRLEIPDLDFESVTIDIRGTKTDGSDRTMPMHPQLRDILLPYIEGLGRTTGPLFTNDAGEPFGDWRKPLDAVSERAGFPRGMVRTRMFRTSYITHRLACIDQGAPIEPYRVAREVGHSSLTMIMRVYGRVQRRRIRMDEMAFRTDAIGPKLQERLHAVYSPPPRERAGAKANAELLARFFAATAKLTTAEVTAATGIPKPTVNRLRGGQASLQRRTRERIDAFLELVDSELPQPQPRERRLSNRQAAPIAA